MQELQSLVAKMRVMPARENSSLTAVVGGLQQAPSAHAAKDWLNQTLKEQTTKKLAYAKERDAQDIIISKGEMEFQRAKEGGGGAVGGTRKHPFAGLLRDLDGVL